MGRDSDIWRFYVSGGNSVWSLRDVWLSIAMIQGAKVLLAFSICYHLSCRFTLLFERLECFL